MATARVVATVVASCSTILSVGFLSFFVMNTKRAKPADSDNNCAGSAYTNAFHFIKLIITALLFLILSDISHFTQTFFIEGQAMNKTMDVRFYRIFQVGKSVFNLIATAIYAVVGLQRLELFQVFIPQRLRRLPSILQSITKFVAPSSIMTATCFHVYRIVHIESTEYDVLRLAAVFMYSTWIIFIFCGTSATLSYLVIRTKSKLSKPTDITIRLFRIILLSIGTNYIVMFSAVASDAMLLNNLAFSGISFILVRVWFAGELVLHYYVRQLINLNDSISSSLQCCDARIKPEYP